MAKLTVVDGPDLGCEYDLDPGPESPRSSVVGRDPRVDVPLSDAAVSREHCRIEAGRRGFRLVDLASRNRTYVNGDPVEEAMLRDGDVIRVGDTDLRFVHEGEAVELDAVHSTIVRAVPVDDGNGGSPAGGLIGHVPGGNGGDTGLLERTRQLLDVSRRLDGTETPAELLERYLEAVVPALDASHGAFLARDDDRWVARQALGPGRETRGTLRATLGLVDRAAREGQAVLSESAPADERLRGRASVVEEGIRSALAVPVLRRRRLLGVVYLDRRGETAPFGPQDLELLGATTEPLASVLEQLERQGRLADENRNLLRGLTEDRRIVGDSEPVRAVLEFVERAAPTPMTVLIQGETGTGKELVASAIHYHSPRRNRPFVTLNCAALPEQLAESELFGHERGAFTGAVTRKKGRFELADSGTVFLDEVGELSPACQAKLLRLLEERVFERVGGTESVRVDVRVIAASNKDLGEALERGEFREDLLYRLNALEVRLPPLRDRRDDIALLARHFLERAPGGRPKRLSKAAEKKLLRYDWPGNVRQLRNVIESACVLGQGDEITSEDLVLPERRRAAASEWEPLSLHELEKRHVLQVLEHTRGNKKRAAEILGIERCTLYSKLKSYD